MLDNPVIMVVDDEDDIRLLVERYLQKWNFQTIGFSDPEKALEEFKSNPSKISLVLTDVRMPFMSGIELSRNILSIRPDVKIVLMTAFEVTDEMLSGLPLIRHSEILKKPFRLAQICESVKRQLMAS